ncbi:MAG: lamin tail domain-containing protein [Verrucomicrobiota bacterium]
MAFRYPSVLCAALAFVSPLPGRAAPLISEFCADNDGTFYDGLGKAEDWIEIYNPDGAPVELGGWKLRAGSGGDWIFPATRLEAGGYLMVVASGRAAQPYTDPAGFLHTGFKLSADGEALALLRPDGSTAHAYAAPVPTQKKDVSYGLVQESVPLVTFDTAAKILVPTAAVDAGWKSDTAFPDAAWIAGKAAAGFGGGKSVVTYQVGEGTAGTQSYAGGLGMDFVVKKAVTVSALGAFDSGGDGMKSTITVRLWRRDEKGTPDNFGDDQAVGAALAQAAFTAADAGILEGGSRFKALAAPLVLEPGAYTIAASGYGDEEPNGNGNGSSWTTDDAGGALSFVGRSRYGGSGPSFPATVDSGPANRYAAGTFRISGLQDPNPRTDLRAAMPGVNASALMRIPFTAAQPEELDSLVLDLPRDDGAVVWLNGTEIARFNAPADLPFNAAATGETAAAARASVTASARLLVPGANLLAIHGLNLSATDGDFFLGAQLTGVKTDSTTIRHFTVPTPGAPNPATGISGYVEDTKFSARRGFYDAPFDLSITTSTPGAEIRYTLDGSPPSETKGTVYSAPIPITTTTVVRAIAVKTGLRTTNVDTLTYLFARDIAVQPSTPPPGYPASWVQDGTTYTADYGMINQTASPANYALSAGSGTYSTEQARTAVADSIRALPVLSIVTDKAEFFDASRGIYLHAPSRGNDWERPISLELITTAGTEDFQADAGIHIMGLTSRTLDMTPKLNMMIVFGSQYGPSWLNRPFFGPDGPPRLKRIALRSNARDSWLAGDFSKATYLGDAWAKHSQRDSGHPATRDRFCHVFINGLYWGLYNPTERPQEHWAETEFGGEDEDYDVVDLCCGLTRLESGDFVEWNELLDKSDAGFDTTAAYQAIQGNNPDGTRNPAFKKLLGVDSLINFALNGYYTASGDWPGNYFAAYDNITERSPGWRFITWDNDLAFQGFSLTANKITPDNNFYTDSPGQVDKGLRRNADYRMRLADTAYKFHFHDGPYSPAKNQARWDRLKAVIQPGLYAESCRWGDYRGTLRTVQGTWKPRVDAAAATYFSGRGAQVLSQMRAAGLYPALAAPEFNQHGGAVPAGFSLVLSAAAGAGIHFTINGADPRLPGGAVTPGVTTVTSGGTATLTQTCTVRARAKNATEWSPLLEVTFIVGKTPASAGNLRITEFDYHPANPDTAEFNAGHTSDALFEFIELTNVSAGELDLTGVRFSAGVEFAFTEGRPLPPGGKVLVVRNQAAFLARYGASLAPLTAGEFTGDTGLSDSGETITLVDHAGAVITSLTYGDNDPWPHSADGDGPSLVLTGTNPADPAAWSPGTGRPTPGTEPSPYSDWVSANFPEAQRADPAITGETADPDGDGLNNLAEFGTGSAPLDPASGPEALALSIRTLTFGEGPAPYHLLTLRSTTAAGYTVTLEESTDLRNWTPNPATLTPTGSADLRPGVRESSFRSANPVAPNARIYWRLRINRP